MATGPVPLFIDRHHSIRKIELLTGITYFLGKEVPFCPVDTISPPAR